ncbi:hypothetical protein GCM10027072_29740 [Streptomyces bullii]
MNPTGPGFVSESGACCDTVRIRGLILAVRHPPFPKAIPSSDRCPIRLTGDEPPTRVRRKRSGTWPTGIAMSVVGATVGE